MGDNGTRRAPEGLDPVEVASVDSFWTGIQVLQGMLTYTESYTGIPVSDPAGLDSLFSQKKRHHKRVSSMQTIR
ncbi:hypothetical protein GCM10022214_59410 [Actinomadura miaoliensis]|uniref:Uncharacterized protein n=1 Tax=Actinomadura miaoliensis TaxID=430685 RepID=A0ABP7WK32_9ACTN